MPVSQPKIKWLSCFYLSKCKSTTMPGVLISDTLPEYKESSSTFFRNKIYVRCLKLQIYVMWVLFLSK